MKHHKTEQDPGLEKLLAAYKEAVQRNGDAAKASKTFAVPEDAPHLDSVELAKLTDAFRAWAEKPGRLDIRASRMRILLLYLLLRYTGAKLGEILALNLPHDIDLERGLVHLGNAKLERRRAVGISQELVTELRNALTGPSLQQRGNEPLRVDEGHIRRKFYERADECGLPRELVNPSSLRRSRAIELLRDGVPLTVVQNLLGHSSANLTASLVAFSDTEVQEINQRFLKREQNRTSSARNAFFGKVAELSNCDIQSELLINTVGGQRIVAVVTNESVRRMGLAPGRLVTAEIKAPWITLVKGTLPEVSSANRLQGTVTAIRRGLINCEVTVKLSDGTEMCTISSTTSLERMGLAEGDQAWTLFDSTAVILLVN